MGMRRGSYRVVPGEFYGTPKEIWGFRTRKRDGTARAIARAFIRSNAAILGVDPSPRGIVHQKTITSLGARHVILQQKHLGRRVHRAYLTVHMDLEGRVYLTKNRTMPTSMLPDRDDSRITEADAVRRARRALPRRTRRATLQTTEEMWFPKEDVLVPAWRVRLARTRPREEWIVHVNARTGGILSKHDNLSKVAGRAWVFDPSPVTTLGGHDQLISPDLVELRPPLEAYRIVTLEALSGSGYLDGKRVTTAPTGRLRRIRRTGGDYFLRSTENGFEEVMCYHHIDAAIRYLESLGFKGSRAVFSEPVRVNVNGTPQDNSWYSPWEKLLTFGTGEIDDAEDGETIVHELGHAIQDAIVPDFGQSEEAAAMGEGFGDYFAASVFADRKPERYRPCVMTWDGLLIGIRDGEDPPCLRRVDGPWTYDDFDTAYDEHENGLIWSATLWDVRAALGGQTADRLIVESHYQQDGFTTFARGARAIIDADRNLNRGTGEADLRRIFRRRRISPV